MALCAERHRVDNKAEGWLSRFTHNIQSPYTRTKFDQLIIERPGLIAANGATAPTKTC